MSCPRVQAFYVLRAGQTHTVKSHVELLAQGVRAIGFQRLALSTMLKGCFNPFGITAVSPSRVGDKTTGNLSGTQNGTDCSVA